MRNPERVDFTNRWAARRLDGTDTVVRHGDYFLAPDVAELLFGISQGEYQDQPRIFVPHR